MQPTPYMRLLGPGLLERVYEVCFCHELAKRRLSFERQKDVPITYDGIVFEEALRVDVSVENHAICELKAVETLHPVYHYQVLSYMKLMKRRLGFLINFNVPLIKDGIHRKIL